MSPATPLHQTRGTPEPPRNPGRFSRQKLAKLRAAADTGLPLPGEQQTLGDYLESWLTDTLPGSVRPSTEASYGDLVRRHIVPALGRVKLDRLTPAQVRSFLRSKQAEDSARGRPLSPRTVQYIHAVPRRALEQACQDELVARNVATLAKAPRVRREEVVPYTPEEARRLLAAARGDRLQALYALALGVGLRRGELLGLPWHCVDLDESALRVRFSLQRVGSVLALTDPKTARSQRTLPLPGFCVQTLKEHRDRQGKEKAGAHVWPNDWDLVFTTLVGTPIEPRNLNRHFDALIRRAGLPRIRFHDLRLAAAGRGRGPPRDHGHPRPLGHRHHAEPVHPRDARHPARRSEPDEPAAAARAGRRSR